MKPLCIVLLSIFALSCLTKTAEEWKSRVIYQIVTDRFGRTGGDTPSCDNLSDYCGGTFKGIEKSLDYIKGMGANAIWISPVVQNSPGGYHGYWHTNIYEINEHFGTKEDLKDLIKACHERDIWVMVDVVPNHVSDVPHEDGVYDFSSIHPFNKPEYYHWGVCLTQEIDRVDPTNQTALENCWLSYLPDLKQEDEFVANTLIEWVTDFVQTYEIDGLRLDATRHVPKWFWDLYTKAAGVFTVGEVWNHDVAYVSGYQEVMDSLLNFPLHGFFDKAFKDFSGMTVFDTYFQETIHKWLNPTIVVNFFDSHDLSRCLHTTDVAYCKTIFGMVLSTVGIPVIYYGDEQSFAGGEDPLNREPLWGHMNSESEMYQFFRTINTFREHSEFYKEEQIQRYVDETCYAFSRGQAFFAFTNSAQDQRKTITSHSYVDGTRLCNIMNEKDCVEVQDGAFQLTFIDKEMKILFPEVTNNEEKPQQSVWQDLKKAYGERIVTSLQGSLSV